MQLTQIADNPLSNNQIFQSLVVCVIQMNDFTIPWLYLAVDTFYTFLGHFLGHFLEHYFGTLFWNTPFSQLKHLFHGDSVAYI